MEILLQNDKNASRKHLWQQPSMEAIFSDWWLLYEAPLQKVTTLSEDSDDFI